MHSRTACALSPSFAPEGDADVTGGVARFGTWVLPFSTGFQLDGASMRQLHLTASHWFIGDQDIYYAKWYVPSLFHATISPLTLPSIPLEDDRKAHFS
jgi:hypothetical protein